MGQVDYLHSQTDGPIFLFIHGIGGNKTNFQPLISCLPDSQCWAVNLPGYGSSALLDVELTFPALSDWLGQFIERQIGQPVHLVGHSIGGMLALEHIIRAPEQAASLTMLGATSAFGGRDDQFKNAFLEQRLAPLEMGKSMYEIAQMTVPDLLGAKAEPQARQAAIDSLSQISEHQWRAILSCLVTFNQREQIASIKKPVCVVAGEQDQNAPAPTLQKMAQKFPHAEYHCLNGIGHLLPLEAPSQIAQIIKTFISS